MYVSTHYKRLFLYNNQETFQSIFIEPHNPLHQTALRPDVYLVSISNS